MTLYFREVRLNPENKNITQKYDQATRHQRQTARHLSMYQD